MSNFDRQALREFEFLTGFGFHFVSALPSRIRLESAKVFLEVWHGRRDGEVAVSFGRLKQGEEFSFTLFLRLVDPAFEAQLGEMLASTPEEVRSCLNVLAGALRTRGQPILCAEESIFERMRDVRWWDFQPDALKDP